MQSFLQGFCLQRFQVMLSPRLLLSRLGADWLLACLLLYNRRSRALSILKCKKSTVLRMIQFHLVDFCHTPLRSFPRCFPKGVLCRLNQKCAPSDGCCNNAHLLLPPPLGLVTTVRYPHPSPLSVHTLLYCSSVSDRAQDDTAVQKLPPLTWGGFCPFHSP